MPSFTVWFADEWGGDDDGGMYDTTIYDYLMLTWSQVRLY